MLGQAEREVVSFKFGGFREGSLSPDWELMEAGYDTFGVVVLIRNEKGELLWTRSAIDKASTGNGASQWQCGVCETSEPEDQEDVLFTAFRGLEQELGPEINGKMTFFYLGEVPFRPKIMARVFLGEWKGEQTREFSFPDGEVDEVKWVPIGMVPSGKIRTASYFVLLMLGKERLQKTLLN